MNKRRVTGRRGPAGAGSRPLCSQKSRRVVGFPGVRRHCIWLECRFLTSWIWFLYLDRPVSILRVWSAPGWSWKPLWSARVGREGCFSIGLATISDRRTMNKNNMPTARILAFRNSNLPIFKDDWQNSSSLQVDCRGRWIGNGRTTDAENTGQGTCPFVVKTTHFQ